MSSDIASEFVGTWRLISYSAAISGGETIYPMGRNAQGRLTYGIPHCIRVFCCHFQKNARRASGRTPPLLPIA